MYSRTFQCSWGWVFAWTCWCIIIITWHTSVMLPTLLRRWLRWSCQDWDLICVCGPSGQEVRHAHLCQLKRIIQIEVAHWSRCPDWPQCFIKRQAGWWHWTQIVILHNQGWMVRFVLYVYLLWLIWYCTTLPKWYTTCYNINPNPKPSWTKKNWGAGNGRGEERSGHQKDMRAVKALQNAS
jgi:hypothetical protein